ncbi:MULTISPECIES: hypothetical protein [unclassified Kaistella]|uniref:hypothetical protein n=1 Tax=unclassified Kaistella TaxID=2762626 RepID=UPI002734AD38|nr:MULTISPECIES: hypothetical protein [unclassified Kaistella]MDP2455230.1 hypothetical protein [Kaistella sp. SH11-4b]MDP2458077.1 hypothetical protein [Kaistella sp. SH40-3]MDP2461044.1 hypothetical protein [Kaistella sp. SH19-2b]
MKKFSITVLLFAGSFALAQNIYIDVTTTLALKLYSDNLENQQEKTLEQQTKLQQAQTWVSTQMTVANNIQNKVLKGLNEVSGTLKNGVQVVSIYNELDRCLQYSSDILELTSDKPQFAVFGVKATQKAYEQVIKLSTDVTDLLKPGELNLATAGDRYKLLFSVSQNVTMLKIWLLATKLNIERAIRLGWFQSINPFQGYINTDMSIVQNIMWTYKNRF